MRKTQRLTTTLLCLILGFLEGIAGPVDIQVAQQRATDFLQQKVGRSIPPEHVSLRYASQNAYLFENSSHFALVAAETELPEILGYGRKTNGTMPPALEGFIKAMKFQQPQSATAQYTPVEPLLPFVRHQKAPYNNCCPFYVDGNGQVTPYRCLVGCVATALEEVISYYRRTVVLQDTLHGWEKETHTPIADILPGTTVDCRLIRNNYDVDAYTPEEADAVARLSYYCGVAAKMNWGISASGANIRNLIAPLKKAFGYHYVEYVDSYKYQPTDWQEMIRTELYAHRPVLYTAYYMWLGGHAFVVDGLDANGYFHVNWGYAGSYDGYFRLDVLNYCEPPEQATPEGMEAGFFINHQALLLHPDPVVKSLPDTLARTGKEIAVDSIHIGLPAETNKRTPIEMYVRNTTDQYLTTPFELFTNAPQDTAILEQGDFIGMTSAILAPYERRKLKIHANFDVAGERILRISPDDVAILYEQPVNILKGTSPQLTFFEPEVSFPKTDEVLVTLTVDNAPTSGRCGQEVLYELGPGGADTMKDGVRHSRHIYVEPGETIKDSVRFKYLKPGETYTLLIRSPWKIQTQKTFVVPLSSGIETNDSQPSSTIVQWFTIDGRRLEHPTRRGLYLRRQGNTTQKVYIDKQK